MITSRAETHNRVEGDPCIIYVDGEPASKANSRAFVKIAGKPRMIKSKKALGYVRDFNIQCPIRRELFEGDTAVAIKIYYASKRPDLDESLILDLLQGKVFKNDRCVKSKYIEWGLSRDNPRVIIVVSSIDNTDLVRDTLIELVSTIDNKELVIPH